MLRGYAGLLREVPTSPATRSSCHGGSNAAGAMQVILLKQLAPLAQLDRASDYESEGYRFDSCGVYFFYCEFQENIALCRRCGAQ